MLKVEGGLPILPPSSVHVTISSRLIGLNKQDCKILKKAVSVNIQPLCIYSLHPFKEKNMFILSPK